jgi:hypothetical protein
MSNKTNELAHKLTVGDKIRVRGFVMLKGLDNGRTYKIIAEDEISFTLKYKSNKPIRHYKYQIYNSMRSLTDLNGITKA